MEGVLTYYYNNSTIMLQPQLFSRHFSHLLKWSTMSGEHNFLHRPTNFFTPFIVNRVSNYENCVRSQKLVTQLGSLNVSN